MVVFVVVIFEDRDEGSLVLVGEEQPLLFAEEQVEQDVQVDPRLHQRANVQLLVELLNGLLLQAHFTVVAAEARGVAEAQEPGVLLQFHSFRLLDQLHSFSFLQLKIVGCRFQLPFHLFSTL